MESGALSMKSDAWRIKCRTAPVGEEGPLIPRYWQDVRILDLHIFERRGADTSLNLDGLIIIDMQLDGGVEGIEILYPLGVDLVSTTLRPRERERYWRLFLAPSDKDLIQQEAIVTGERIGSTATLRFATGDVDSRYLVGPGARALVGANELRGLEFNLAEFER